VGYIKWSDFIVRFPGGSIKENADLDSEHELIKTLIKVDGDEKLIDIEDIETETHKRVFDSNYEQSYIYFRWIDTGKNRMFYSRDPFYENGVLMEFDSFEVHESIEDYRPSRTQDCYIKEDPYTAWYRIVVYTANYTDYTKIFRWYKFEEKESHEPVEPSDTISNIKHWVKYNY